MLDRGQTKFKRSKLKSKDGFRLVMEFLDVATKGTVDEGHLRKLWGADDAEYMINIERCQAEHDHVLRRQNKLLTMMKFVGFEHYYAVYAVHAQVQFGGVLQTAADYKAAVI